MYHEHDEENELLGGNTGARNVAEEAQPTNTTDQALPPSAPNIDKEQDPKVSDNSGTNVKFSKVAVVSPYPVDLVVPNANSSAEPVVDLSTLLAEDATLGIAGPAQTNVPTANDIVIVATNPTDDVDTTDPTANDNSADPPIPTTEERSNTSLG